MAEERHGEATEPATPRRREESRRRGHIARSHDLSAAAILLASIVALRWFGEDTLTGVLVGAQVILEEAGRFDLSADNVQGYGFAFLMGAGRILAPVLLVIFATAIAINLGQVGFLLTTETLGFNLDRLNPISGLQRLFTLRGLVRVGASIAKIGVITAVVWTVLRDHTNAFGLLMDMDVREIVRFLLDVAWLLSVRVGVALLILALLDYAYQRWQYEMDIRMSRDEIQEEMKSLEGDPMVRRRRRQIQRTLAVQRMMAAVPKAAVVITNPTELSVAIEYEPDRMDAPRVVAKGAGHVAQRIREIAMENGIQIVRKPDLAQTLYEVVEVGQWIPTDLYQAVADILAYVYKVTGRQVPHPAKA